MLFVGEFDLNTITTYYSGKSFQITDSSQQDYGDTAVPNQVSQPAISGTSYVGGGNFPNYIVNNGNYTKLPDATANGNVGRNTVRGPGYFNLDVGLTRNIPIYREFAVVLKAESFEVTNTPSGVNRSATLAMPNSVKSSVCSAPATAHYALAVASPSRPLSHCLVARRGWSALPTSQNP